MNENLVKVDVREDIRGGREPFSRIMRAVAELKSGQRLLLVAPFKPIALLEVMAQRGFECSSKQNASGDWEVLFTSLTAVQPVHDSPARTPADARINPGPSKIVVVDARGLEPPQPLVKILEALAALPSGAELCARTDRRPVHLYGHLAERGSTAETEEESDGTFLTHIRTR